MHRQGQRQRSPHFTVIVLPRSIAGEDRVVSQFGVTISQKVSKRAVIRNRLKRQITAAIQQLLPQVASSHWVVIVVRPSAVECTYGQFLQELRQLFIDLEVIHGD